METLPGQVHTSNTYVSDEVTGIPTKSFYGNKPGENMMLKLLCSVT